MGVMRILYVADGRSMTALNWISYFVAQGHEVHLASTSPCQPDFELASLQVIPVAFSRAGGDQHGAQSTSLLMRFATVGMRTKIRQMLGPLTLSRATDEMRSLITELKPDLIHAMRIPFEGMLAARAAHGVNTPLLISVWGNDFTLHANSTRLMAAHTRRALQRADALHTDTQRDQKLALEWGFSPEKPVIVLPGGGGIQPDIFYPPAAPSADPVIINPRGVRAYIRNDTFFRAVPLVLAQRPDAYFLCPAMQGEPEAQRWLAKYDLSYSVELLPRQTRLQMADLFRRALVAVSISEHDGTPNTLLEAMACGCFPIAGDIESLREWLTHGQNGLLVDPGDHRTLADAILQALEHANLRTQAAAYNSKLVAERVEYNAVMGRAQEFYSKLRN
jgi:glycosyltransferase involved in cell wall biosynthesis